MRSSERGRRKKFLWRSSLEEERNFLGGAAWTKTEMSWKEQQERRKTFPVRRRDKEGRHFLVGAVKKKEDISLEEQ